ncbi:MAG: hypothetical protein A2132_01715 [Nitrospirae bacterium RBG_16_43_11]|nr:MAG: hypothetical protein A2132_01715 [Nitrospirae bacterium RBG_16_43_11]
MIDIHCHILPGTDDGPETIEESLEMCRIAALDGIKVIVATPHFRPGISESSQEKVSDLIAILMDKVKQECIDLQILPGSEVTFTAEMPDYIRNNEYLTINGNGRYFLTEFYPSAVPLHWETVLLSMLHSGYVPVLAHPERNSFFMNNPEGLSAIVRSGVLVQITAMSVTGELGEEIQRLSIFLLKHNLVHVIATDAHSSVHRVPMLAEAVSIAADVIGKEHASALVTSVPAAITGGKTVIFPPPQLSDQKKKRWPQNILMQ